MEWLSIAGGELQHHRDGQSPQAIESRFASDLLARDAASRRTTSWKHAEREDNERGMLPAPSCGAVVAPRPTRWRLRAFCTPAAAASPACCTTC